MVKSLRAHYRAIARVVKPHGKRGEVVTVPVHGLPPLLREGMAVALVPPALKESRWHEVVSVSGSGGTGELVALSGSRDLGTAEGLAGKVILARVEDLPAGYELHDVDALIGHEVSDASLGPLGTIEEVMVGVANDVWVVRGRHGEVLVPVVDEFVSEVPAEGPIVVRVPDGTVSDEGA